MRTFLKVLVFNVVVIGFFLYVGNSIPQLSQPPPQDLVLAADAPVEDFVKAGSEIFFGKGTCALCHEIGKLNALVLETRRVYVGEIVGHCIERSAVSHQGLPRRI